MLHSDLLQLPHRCRYNWSSVLIMHIRCQAVRVSLFLHSLSKEIQRKKCFWMKSCSLPLKYHFCTTLVQNQHLAGHEHCLPWTCYSLSGWNSFYDVTAFLVICVLCLLSPCRLWSCRGIFVSPDCYKARSFERRITRADVWESLWLIVSIFLYLCGTSCASFVLYVLLSYLWCHQKNAVSVTRLCPRSFWATH